MNYLFISLFLSSALLSNDATMMREGGKIYKQTCVSCHGENGESNDAMNLVVKPRKLNKTILTQEQSFKIIKEGGRHWGAHSDIMPAFKYVYSDQQIKAVSFYITQKFNPKRDEKIKKLLSEVKIDLQDKAKMLQTGAKIFTKNCSLCHGVKGDGESDYVKTSQNNDEFIYPYNLQRTLLKENQIFLYAKYGGYFWGTNKDHMPSWKKKYNDTQLYSVAKYIELQIKNMEK